MTFPCAIHHPRIDQALQTLREAVDAHAVPAYTEQNQPPGRPRRRRGAAGATDRGLLRYVQLTAVASYRHETCGLKAQDDARALVQVVLVVNADRGDARTAPALALAEQLFEARGPQSDDPLFHSIWLNFNPAAHNVILSDHWELLAGEEWVWHTMGGADIALAPGSFAQANFGAMDQALAAIAEFTPAGSAVLDLHAGVGTIGLSLMANGRCASLRCVDVNRQGKVAFDLAVKRLPAELRMRTATYHVGAAGDCPLEWLESADVLCVDPPRKGLESSLIKLLLTPKDRARTKARRLIYLSCGFQSLTKDVDLLVGSGLWYIVHASAFVFFPGTDSLETLVVMDERV